MSLKLLRRYVKLALNEHTPLARVPNQLIDPDDVEETEEDEESLDDQQESSGVGAISGCSAPLSNDRSRRS